MSFDKVGTSGVIGINFNQEMLVAQGLNYSSVFRLTIYAEQDASTNVGTFGGAVEKRKLQMSSKTKADDSAALMSFSWWVSHHNSTRIEIETEFDDPRQVSTSRYGYDKMIIDILTPGIFISS